MTFLAEVSRLYKRCEEIWDKENGKDLEVTGGGFGVTLEVLQDEQRCVKLYFLWKKK